MNTSLRLAVTDSSQAGEARRTSSTWARERGCNAEFIGKLALVVTELANNLALHTRGGVLLLRDLSVGENAGVEVLSLDTGPGVANFSECLRDGHSTAGTSGTGLGAVMRASHLFEVHSQPEIGTALLSELWARPPQPEASGFRIGGASVPIAGEEACGDTWAMQHAEKGRMRLMVADGLGHGILAAAASRKAAEYFLNGMNDPLPRVMESMHLAMRSTRGAAVAIAEVDSRQGRVSFVGIGNIAAALVRQEKTTSLISHNGTLGVHYRNAQQFEYPWTKDSALVMQSDGVKTSWQMDRYRGLTSRHPSLISGVIYRDFHRSNDDSTIVLVGNDP